MRILITGSRDWTDDQAIIEALVYHGDETTVVVHGDCPTGADRIASEICKQEEWKQEKHPADWKRYGRSAGPKRNKEMVDSGIDLCLAFVKNKSKGASMTVDLCHKAGVPVEIQEST